MLLFDAHPSLKQTKKRVTHHIYNIHPELGGAWLVFNGICPQLASLLLAPEIDIFVLNNQLLCNAKLITSLECISKYDQNLSKS